jgi:hypothetical protein
MNQHNTSVAYYVRQSGFPRFYVIRTRSYLTSVETVPVLIMILNLITSLTKHTYVYVIHECNVANYGCVLIFVFVVCYRNLISLPVNGKV